MSKDIKTNLLFCLFLELNLVYTSAIVLTLNFAEIVNVHFLVNQSDKKKNGNLFLKGTELNLKLLVIT